MGSGAVHGSSVLGNRRPGFILSAFAEKIQYMHRPVEGAPHPSVRLFLYYNKGTPLRGLSVERSCPEPSRVIHSVGPRRPHVPQSGRRDTLVLHPVGDAMLYVPSC